MMELDPYKAHKPDGNSLFVLKECADTLDMPLGMLFKNLLGDGSLKNGRELMSCQYLKERRQGGSFMHIGPQLQCTVEYTYSA